MTKTAYIAAPLFCEAEKRFNLAVDEAVHAAGLTTYLPQRDAPHVTNASRHETGEAAARLAIFEADTRAVRVCDVFVMVLDGRVPDEGACVELGIAYSFAKPSFGLHTDTRVFGQDSSTNLMIDCAITGGMASSLPALTDLLKEFVAKIELG
jgi:nucleoside 2-deoxyribosyltransferase